MLKYEVTCVYCPIGKKYGNPRIYRTKAGIEKFKQLHDIPNSVQVKVLRGKNNGKKS